MHCQAVFFTEDKELGMFRMKNFHVIVYIYIFMCMYVHIHMVHVYFCLCIYLYGIYTYISSQYLYTCVYVCIDDINMYIYICCIQWEAKERDTPLKHSTSMSLTSCQTSDVSGTTVRTTFSYVLFLFGTHPFQWAAGIYDTRSICEFHIYFLSMKLQPVEFLGVKFLAGGFLYPVHVQWSQRGWPLATSWSATTQRKSPTGGALNDALRWFLRDQRWCREGGIWLVKGSWGERWLKCLRRCLSWGEIEGTHLEVYLLGEVFGDAPIGDTRLWKVSVFLGGGEWQGFWGL